METAGTIKTIQLVNFMCHNNFQIDLNPRLNFICGQNGSGKSAIQTALVIGLGGKAGWTGRGDSVKELVKRGKNYCTIKITLVNCGYRAYHPDVYGREIIVERQITASGPSSYKLKSESGTVISKYKEELDKIMSSFNIQINNPLAILHQDVARSFLNVDDAKAKYTFFAKALLFDEIVESHNGVYTNTYDSDDAVFKRTIRLENAFQDIKELQKKIDILEILEKKHREREEVQNELAWAKVNEEQELLDNHLRQKEKINQNIQKLKDRLLQYSENDASCVQKKLDLEETLNKIKDDIERQNNEITNKTTELRNKRLNFEIMNEKIKQSESNLEKLRRKERAVEEIIHKSTHRDPELEMKREADKIQLNICKEKLLDLDSVIQTSELEHSQLRESIERLSSDQEKYSNQSLTCLRELSNVQDKMTKLKRERNNLSMYSNYMPTLVDAIKAEKRFKEMPRGPLGAYIKVKDPSWAPAVEQYIGKKTLGAFCVSNQQDSMLLQDIMKKVCHHFKPTVYCAQFFHKVHDVREVTLNGYCNVFRALQFQDPVVANCLIDNLEIETVLMIATNEEAFKIMGEIQNVPRYCKRAFTKEADVFYPAPNYRSYAGNMGTNQALLLQVDNKHTIRILEEKVKELSGQKMEVNNSLSSTQRHLLDLKTRDRKLQTDIQRYIKNKQQLIMNMKQLQEKDHEDNQTVLPRQLEAELHELQEQKSQVETNLKDSKEQCVPLKTELEDVKQEVDNLNEGLKSYLSSKSRINAEVLKIDSMLRNKASEEAQCKEKLSQQEELLSNRNEVIEKSNNAITKLIADANILAPEGFQNTRKIEVLLSELNQLDAYIKAVESNSGGDLIQIKSRLQLREKDYNSKKLHLDLFKLEMTKTEAIVNARVRTYKKMRKTYGVSLETAFDAILTVCKFKGELNVDHKQKELRIQVFPLQESGEDVRSTSSLSGGEKSYATAAFIMALWAYVNLPFYFLDEFDVFMDTVNRERILQMLISRARKFKKQFVFLTPHNTSVVAAEDLQIFRLEPPVRDEDQ